MEIKRSGMIYLTKLDHQTVRIERRGALSRTGPISEILRKDISPDIMARLKGAGIGETTELPKNYVAAEWQLRTWLELVQEIHDLSKNKENLLSAPKEEPEVQKEPLTILKLDNLLAYLNTKKIKEGK